MSIGDPFARVDLKLTLNSRQMPIWREPPGLIAITWDREGRTEGEYADFLQRVIHEARQGGTRGIAVATQYRTHCDWMVEVNGEHHIEFIDP